jgi:Tfp pilus assembly protein PilP
MKLKIGIMVLVIASTAFGQTSNVIESTRTKLHTVEQQKGADLNAVTPGVQATSAKPSPSGAKASTAVTNVAPISKGAIATQLQKPKVASTPTVSKAVTTPVKPVSKSTSAKAAEAKTSKAKSPQAVAGNTKLATPQPAVAVEDTKNPLDAKKETPKKQINLTGRRDPFLSPVVSRAAGGSGCSTGKRCLAIDQIALKGVVRSDTGMIAVVTNVLEKAYFLHENDPVFNGYVVKITGDSIVFKETIQDKLGKSLTREVTKKITTPVA